MINMVLGVSTGLGVSLIAIMCVNLYANKRYTGKTWRGFKYLILPFVGKRD